MTLAIRLRDALNAHDLEGLLGCFHEDYTSEQPVHPGRAFVGREQVRTNWSTMFQAVPDFTAELLGHCDGEGKEWSEWRWTGTRPDGAEWRWTGTRREDGMFDMAGVIVVGVRDDRIAWGRLYIEPVEPAGEGVDAAEELT